MTLFNNEITIYRHNAGTYIKGVWETGKLNSIIRLIASVQPITGRDIYNLPEGVSQKIRYKIYFDEPQELLLSDIIKIDDKMYMIINDNNWSDAPFLVHNKLYVGDIS